jgi:hypothetical protein
VQLQNPNEVAANAGAGINLVGDGIALELDLSAITGSTTLTLINNLSPDAITGVFEHGTTMSLYGEGEAILGTGFNGTVEISYVGGDGNDVVLSLLSESLAGDYSGDGIVDILDYVVWRASGIGGEQGYSDWSQNYGAGNAAPQSAQVPEPTGFILAAIALATFCRSRSRMLNRRS